MRSRRITKKVDERKIMLRFIKKHDFVLLVTDAGNERISTKEAILRAENKGLDLILLSGHGKEPVVTIKDFNKHNYEKKKKKTTKKPSKQREITMNACIGENDLKVKLRKIDEILKSKNPVNIVISTRYTRKHRHKGLTIEGLRQIGLKLVETIKSKELGSPGRINEEKLKITFIIIPSKTTKTNFPR
jgi:translation initiation factor IF-3